MERLVMSKRERTRLEVFGRVKRGELLLRKAAELLQLSYRQAKRVYARFRQEGDKGLVHRLRGQASNRQVDQAKKQAALGFCREKYADFGPTLAAEYLAKEGLRVSVETLRGWLLAAGLWQVRRQRALHRRWRARKEHLGEMVQMDGSHHDWFEGRRDWAVLMVMIDDATNFTYARFFEAETTEAAMTLVCHYIKRYGLPRAFYVDRDSIYRVNREATVDEQLAGEPALSQFARAMKELGVELICAHSPQAKGRVERRNGVLQDRLVKALRLEGISDLESANHYLDETFLPELNARFTVAAKRRANLHRRLPAGVDLARVLAFQEERVVQNDWTVRWRNRWFQLTAANQRWSMVRKRVLVCEQLGGTIRLFYHGRELVWQELPERPEPRSAKRSAAAMSGEAVVPMPVWQRAQRRAQPRRHGPTKPAADHPWRRSKLA
jgi:transposase